MRLMLTLLAMLVLAGCAGTPQFTELRTSVTPPAELEPSADAELSVRLHDASGTLAETSLGQLSSGPWPVVLRYDSRSLEEARAPQLSAELRQQGRLTHVTEEPVLLRADASDESITLPLSPRPGTSPP
ncbi:YbaY family lipoprotein [Billgrantia endophytica]|nr:YbaY family lipoprotein [Halomonas endophytica]